MNNQDTQVTKYRAPNGKLTAPIPGSEKHQFTPVTARSAVQKRWENYRRAAVKRIVDEAASIDPTVSTGADAFGLVAAKQFSALMDSDKPAVDQLHKLGQIMTGATGSDPSSTNVSAGQITTDASTLLELLTMLEQHKRHAVEQARSTDVLTITEITESE